MRRYIAIAGVLAFSLTVAGISTAYADIGETVIGKPIIEDGDTLDFNGRKINLYGLDAPELGQRCFTKKLASIKFDPTTKYDGGEAAKAGLKEFIGNANVTCTIARKKYQVEWANCGTPTIRSLTEEMIKSGLVFAEGIVVPEAVQRARVGKGIYIGEYDRGCLSPYWERERRNITQP
jgi:endonuclease YncB( thermonuclease family)